jgi:mannose-6-phosphate isomerase-like protein (cupin superfamily)
MRDLSAGVTPSGQGQDRTVWNILGHTYWLKAESEGCFCFETLDPPGTGVPLHIHPSQDEFIYMLEGSFELELGGARLQARAGDLVRMPRGVPHSYANAAAIPARALFWVTPARRLRALFDQLHELADIAEMVRLSALHEVEFIR